MYTASQNMEMFIGNADECKTQSIIDPMMLNHLYICINIIMLALYLEDNQIIYGQYSTGSSVYIVS